MCALIIDKGVSSRESPSLRSRHHPLAPLLPPEIEAGHTQYDDDLSEQKPVERQAFTQSRPLGLFNQGEGCGGISLRCFLSYYYGGGGKIDWGSEGRETPPPIDREQEQERYES